ncbi:4'-phosphopantetheinyl transferase family protein [Streptomyces boncukensis]|uniref:4'-phosphopantetheinyl transferase superfamily protein n=1 Tax=Streptomyces boncukensis TaxID=2711219 RepID=A0A6G4X4V9_9ACTN|nr:4'-phosphopantetheinyl transferase superfamily protein [Streptomyces boncukensis]NGO71887.1 4'-phosphopantetheinyl transferase superfamily protein [Streptomyces boncukensis]
MARLVARPAAGEVQVWWAAPHHGSDARHDLRTLLDDRELTRWRRLRRPAARALYLTAHALARLVLAAHTGGHPAALEFRTACVHCGGPHGKPQPLVPGGWQLSLSHSGQRVAVAVSQGLPLGVDVEQVRRRPDALAETVLTGTERAALARRPAHGRAGDFIRYWARKESALKATGDGVMTEPVRLTVSAPGEPPALLSWRTDPAPPALPHLTDLDPGPGYRACLAVLGVPRRVTEHDATPLLLPAPAPAPSAAMRT